jgi:hypothetical protein
MPESWFGRRRRAIAGVALGVASVIVLAACGSSSPSSSSGSGSSASGSAAKTYTLTIGVGSPNLSYAAFWVAMANNLFAKNGVNVKVSSYNTDGQSPNLLAAHKIQLQVFGPVTAAQLDLRGQQASYLDTLSNYGPSVEAVVGAKGINTVAQLRNTKNCRIATDEVGTLPYAFSVLYQKAEKLTNCTLVITSGAPAVAAEVGAGTAQAGIETYSTALALLDAKKATLLLDPLNVPAWLKAEVAPHSYALGGVLGIPSVIQQNKTAVVRFLKAIRQGNALLLKSSVPTLAQETSKLTAFSGTTVASLENAWKGTLLEVPTGSNAGYVTQTAWQQTVIGLKSWSLPSYDATSPSLAYSKAVNMTYFNQAGG